MQLSYSYNNVRNDYDKMASDKKTKEFHVNICNKTPELLAKIPI